MENPLQLEMTDTNGINATQHSTLQVRTPKKVLHFSDGVIEEFSDDEIDSAKPVETTVIDTKSLGWVPWFKYYAWASSIKTLEYCDYVGEGLANFLGITTPKYQLEISEHERMEAASKKMQEESAGWVTSESSENPPLVVLQPGSTPSENPASV